MAPLARASGRSRPLIASLLLSCLLFAATAAQAQVYIPPPDDLIEELPVLPAAGETPLPQSLPPPPPAPDSMTPEQAKAEARAAGSALRETYQNLTQAANAAAQVPGYEATYPGLTQYYDNPGEMYAAGAAEGYSSEAYRTANSTSRPTVNVTRDDMARATAIEASPDAYLDGVGADGSTGDCTPLPPGPGTPNSAEWTCHVGSQVIEETKSCTSNLVVTEWSALTYQYLCAISAGFDGCSALAGNGQCRRTASYPIPDYGITIDYYDCSSAVADPNIYLLGTVPARPRPAPSKS